MLAENGVEKRKYPTKSFSIKIQLLKTQWTESQTKWENTFHFIQFLNKMYLFDIHNSSWAQEDEES